MPYKFWIFALLILLPVLFYAQESTPFLEGEVMHEISAEEEIPLIGAEVQWQGTSLGAVTDAEGKFRIEKTAETNKLIIGYVGYRVDTFVIGEEAFVHIHLEPSVTMNEVEVVHRRKSTEISFIDPLKTENIGEKEFLKAACCNLSESFETIPSVDVSFTDAVTGTRQIQMLGLAGPYTQITRENMPDVRGLSALYGLTYVPGTWVEGIQLIKGTGSVANGFESIAGQINVEYRKPEEAERLYLNAYLNEGGRVELNANIAHRFKDNKWSSALLLHGKNNALKWDRNDDGFLDEPLTNQFIGLNRWKYIGPKGIRFQVGVKGTFIESRGGQMAFDPTSDALTTNNWGMKLNTQRMEGWAKLGKVFEEKPWQTVGVQISGARHNQDSYFGLNAFDASQTTGYANLMYQSIFKNTNHKFRTGASVQYDDYDELLNATSFDRTEMTVGGYFEYTYNLLDKFNVIAGLRADYHNRFGAFVTPRLHLRYAVTENTVLRAGGGRGQRTANILSENTGLLASARQIVIMGDGSNKPYGLEPEVAWNFGGSITQSFRLGYRDGSISLDVFRTDFDNQIVVDLDQNPQQAVFYNLDGKSYSNSVQLQMDYEVVKRLDVRLAYRWFDVKTTFDGTLLQKPLVSTHRAFLNLAYKTRNHWAFDYTINWQGQKRIPFTGSNPTEYQLPERSPDFVLMNAQISKTWKEKFEVYAGVENLLNFHQTNPILSAEAPFSPYFDSALIWGPVFGRNIYVGLRYRLP